MQRMRKIQDYITRFENQEYASLQWATKRK
jgi:hypothetical protein